MKKTLLFVVTILIITISSCRVTRKDVAGVTGRISMHPAEMKLTATDKKVYYLFYVYDKKILFISPEAGIQEKFIKHLPEQKIPGRYIDMIGTTIEALTYFTKEQLDQVSQQIGAKLNHAKVAMVTNWELSPEDGSGTHTNTTDPADPWHRPQN